MNTTKEIAMFYGYLREGITAFFEDDLCLIKSLSPDLNCIPFESINTKINGPDFLIHVPNSSKIIVVEHFEFDSSKSIKNKGNTNRIELARIHRDFNKFTLKRDQKFFHSRDEIKCEYSVEHYINNLLRVLNKHLENAEEYISNVLKVFPNKTREDIILTFMIMDTTPLGSYYEAKDRPIPFSFFQLKEFQEQSYPIDGFFAGFHNYSTSEIFYCSTRNLEALKDKLPVVDLNGEKYFAFPTPQVSSFITFVD